MKKRLEDYRDAYECVAVERSDGVLQLRLHTNGGPLLWNEVAHRELPALFADVATDRDNRVVVLTGTGDAFCDAIDAGDWPLAAPRDWDKIYWEGKRLLRGLLDIEVPVIAAVNGPARVHAELAVLCDVVIASESTVFQDAAHFTSSSQVVPGDGVHVIWPLLLGPNRARYFLLTGQEIGAREALTLGIVGEVVPQASVLPRALELAREFAARPLLTLRYSRVALTHELRRAMETGLGYGLALEGHSALDRDR